MEVHLRADERTLVVRVRNLLLLAVERLPLDVLPRHILRTDDPALAAGAAVVEQGAPLIITGNRTVEAVTIIAAIDLIGARLLEIRVAIVQAQEQAVVLIVGVRLDIVREEADVLGKIEPAGQDIGAVVLDFMIAPRCEMARILLVEIALVFRVLAIRRPPSAPQEQRTWICPAHKEIPLRAEAGLYGAAPP